MKDAPAFDFYPERFWFAVEGWPDSDILRYFRLLSQQWMRDGLPESRKELDGLARGKVSDRVLEKFPVSEDGKRRNAFLEKLRSEQRERITKARASAAVRWGKNKASRICSTDANAYANASTEHDPSICSHSIISPSLPSPQVQAPTAGAREIPPVTLEVAKQQGPQMGVSEEAAEMWWHDHDARGWVDSRGQQVRNWRSSLTAYGNRWRANESRNGSAIPPEKTHGKQPPALF